METEVQIERCWKREVWDDLFSVFVFNLASQIPSGPPMRRFLCLFNWY